MKITRAESVSEHITKLKEDGYEKAIEIYVHKERKDKQAIMISPNYEGDVILLCLSRLSRIIASSMDIPYPTLLEILKKNEEFDRRYGNLNLSDEQLEKMINKDFRGF